MDLPFDGAISEYFKSEAPKPIRKAIENGDRATLERILAQASEYRSHWKQN